MSCNTEYFRNPSHTSHFDLQEHVTVRLATEEQVAAGKAQTVHIYFDDKVNYTGHKLYVGADVFVGEAPADFREGSPFRVGIELLMTEPKKFVAVCLEHTALLATNRI